MRNLTDHKTGQGRRLSRLVALKGFSDFSAQLVSIIFIYTEIRIATENVR